MWLRPVNSTLPVIVCSIYFIASAIASQLEVKLQGKETSLAFMSISLLDLIAFAPKFTLH